MIKHELLSEVLGYECTMPYYTEGQVNIQLFVKGAFNVSSINIYELAHKCKEWAFEQGYALYIKIRPDILDLKDVNHFYVVQIGTGSDKNANQFYGDSEPDAIFSATEWIQENK